MKINNRKELKEILNMNISDSEKINLIANLKNHKTHAMRMIEVDEILDLEIGQVWDNQGSATSWSDMEKKGAAFNAETTREVRYLLEVDEVEGYEVQYLGYDNIFDELYYEQDLEEDEADEIAYNLSNDEVYKAVMDLLGSDGDMDSEREILVPAETKMKIIEISDAREDEGYIYIKLEVIK